MIESTPLCFESCKLQIITQSRRREEFTCLAQYFVEKAASNHGRDLFLSWNDDVARLTKLHWVNNAEYTPCPLIKSNKSKFKGRSPGNDGRVPPSVIKNLVIFDSNKIEHYVNRQLRKSNCTTAHYTMQRTLTGRKNGTPYSHRWDERRFKKKLPTLSTLLSPVTP